MKQKLFSIFFVLALMLSGSVWAQEQQIRNPNLDYANNSIEDLEDELNLDGISPMLTGPSRSPQATYGFYQTIDYVIARQINGSSALQFIYHSSAGNIGSFKPVTTYSNTDIRGSYSFGVSGNNCASSNYYAIYRKSGSNYYYLDNMHGTMTFTSQGTSSGGYPQYAISISATGYVYESLYGCTGYSFSFSRTVPVRGQNSSQTAISLKNSTIISTSATNGSVSGGGTYYDVNQNVSLKATPNTGYHFVNWTGGNTSNPRSVKVGHDDVTYTANFAANTYTVIFNANGGEGSMSNQGFTYDTPQNITNCNFTRNGHTFGGWATSAERAEAGNVDYTNGQSVNNLSVVNGGNVNLYAVWEEIPAVGTPHTITLNVGEHGSVSVYNETRGKLVSFTDNEADILEGDEITITITANPHYQIGTHTYSDVGNFNSGASFEIDAPHTITVTFVPDVYAITYKDKNNQTFSGTHGSGYPTTHTYDTPTSLVSPTKEGMVFGGWYENSACTGTSVTTISATAKTADFTLYAKWQGLITTTVSSFTYGTVTAGGTYDLNTSISLTASSKNDRYYKFDHWEKDGDTYVGGATITPTVTGNATYTAVFRDAKAGTITATVNNASYGTATASPSDNQPGGTAVTLIASAKSGYAFTGWDDNNDGVVDNTDAVRTVYVDGDKEYVAKFVVETASWANYSYDNAQDIIQRDIYQESNAACEAYYSPAGQKFVEVIAVNKSRSTKNYLQLYFKTTTTNYTYPDGEIGPTPGTYLANSGVGDRITSALVPCEGYVYEQNLYFWNWNSWPYECVIGYFKDNTGTGLGENSFSAFLADVNYNSQNPSITNTYQIGSNNFRIIVDTGKDGHMYLQVRRVSNNELLVNIGEPAQPYNLAWDANGGELSGTYTAAGSVNEGTSITAPTATKNGYTFVKWRDVTNGVDFTGTMPSSNVTYTAQWNIVNYNLTYEGLEGATNNTNPDTYNVESETITLAAPGARDGYAFIGWTINGTPVTEITHGSTGDKTITANWNAKLSSITLEDNRENSFYNTFKSTYDGATGLIVTYARQFTQGRWSTLCLPFDVNKAMFSTLNFGSRIYEFKYATGNADDGVNLYFSIAKSIEAGKGYIVNADAKLAARTSFTFSGVTMDLSADNGAELNSVKAYDNLTNGCSTEGSNIELVGTLRKGILKGSDGNNRYMGLKENKIYYPNIATGSTILAYRGIFRSIEGTLNAERIRIIVDGEEKAELEVINGELQDVQETKKFIENGVLYIERNGIIYDAQGQRIE